MPKAPRHRKRTRQARQDATAAPLGSHPLAADSAPATASEENGIETTKKLGKKEQEVQNLIDKLTSKDSEERVWASSALANLLLTLPAVTLRLLLSKNLIGLLIERLGDEEDQVVVESLGALRNLAVTSPISLFLEMINKKLLPALLHQLTILSPLLPSLLIPYTATPYPLPCSPSDRQSIDLLNAKSEQRRSLYWDWTENVLMLFWVATEANDKTLEKLNTEEIRRGLVEFIGKLLEVDALGLGERKEENGMEVENVAGKKKKDSKKGGGGNRERVPMFVALTAAQTLSSFFSSNPIPHNLLTFSPSLPSLLSLLSLTSLPPSLKPTKTDTHTSTPSSDNEDFLLIRITIFGVLLEISKNWEKGDVRGKGKKGTGEKDEIMEAIKEVLKEKSGLLLGLLGTDLEEVARKSVEAGVNVPATPEPGTPSAPVALLASYEKTLSTLQHSLEILSEWCAVLDKESFGGSLIIDEEEEWGGIIEGKDVEMDMDDDDSEDEIIGGKPPGSDDGMDEEEKPVVVELTTSSMELFKQLPAVLLKLAKPTSISFAPVQESTVKKAVNLPGGLIPTSTTDETSNTTTTNSKIPEATTPVSDLLTTIHIRSLSTLNNLYITLSRFFLSSASTRKVLSGDKEFQSDLQRVWEGVLELTLSGARGDLGLGKGGEGEDEEETERRREVVGTGVGVVWGVSRVGLGEGGALIVGDATTPFLISLFSHPFASSQTPSGESLRVRIAGSLGWIGRRSSVSPAENEQIGTFLLSVLPDGKDMSPLLPTAEVLIQTVDSVIDLYADEESAYDKVVFRKGGFLQRLERAVPGVRAATKKIDRKKFPELRTRADGALENLVAFVAYRKDVARV